MTKYFVYGSVVLALAALVVGIVAGLGHRWQWWSLGSSFVLLKWAVYGAIAALVLSAPALFFARPGSGQAGFTWALLACLLSIVVISVPAFWMARAKQAPRIHDITTDTLDPPQFVAVLPLRRDAPNPVDYAGIDTAIQQQQAYPDIHSLLFKDGPQEIYERALAAVNGLGWDIVAAVPEDRRIEATDTTFWFGFKDDIVIRIRGMDGGSRLDIRSVSREGLSDVGTNARRIRAFFKRVNHETNGE